jgi:hypothetical protein
MQVYINDKMKIENGLSELHNKKQFGESARALACLYATYLMG